MVGKEGDEEEGEGAGVDHHCTITAPSLHHHVSAGSSLPVVQVRADDGAVMVQWWSRADAWNRVYI